jgi:hypothetical protein
VDVLSKKKRANVWLVAGGTFGRRAASGFAAGAVSRIAELTEGV